MFSYSALNYSYLVLHVRASASILYIVQFPTPPPHIGVEECTHVVMANLGPQSDAQVLCGVAVTLLVWRLRKCFLGGGVWLVD